MGNSCVGSSKSGAAPKKVKNTRKVSQVSKQASTQQTYQESRSDLNTNNTNDVESKSYNNNNLSADRQASKKRLSHQISARKYDLAGKNNMIKSEGMGIMQDLNEQNCTELLQYYCDCSEEDKKKAAPVIQNMLNQIKITMKEQEYRINDILVENSENPVDRFSEFRNKQGIIQLVPRISQNIGSSMILQKRKMLVENINLENKLVASNEDL